MSKKMKILLIDDEALVRDELGGILSDEGFEVITGADGEEGLELFRSEKPDMVITDVRMPQRDGLSVAVTIRKEDPMVPVTVITGHGTETMAIEALRAGVTDFIKKPVRVDDLTASVARMEAARRPVDRAQVELPASVEIVERGWTFKLQNDLGVIPAFVDHLLELFAAGVDRVAVLELSLALRELIVNAIEHGNLGLSYEWNALPDPTDLPNLLSTHGRGILLARMSVDSMTFNEKGNQATVEKLI
jgi:CheY-like chemotaxis protein